MQGEVVRARHRDLRRSSAADGVAAAGDGQRVGPIVGLIYRGAVVAAAVRAGGKRHRPPGRVFDQNRVDLGAGGQQRVGVVLIEQARMPAQDDVPAAFRVDRCARIPIEGCNKGIDYRRINYTQNCLRRGVERDVRGNCRQHMTAGVDHPLVKPRRRRRDPAQVDKSV